MREIDTSLDTILSIVIIVLAIAAFILLFTVGVMAFFSILMVMVIISLVFVCSQR